MEKPIVSPKQMPVHKVLGRVAEWYRMMSEAGLIFDDLQRPIDDPDFRQRLVEFWKSGAVKIDTHTKSVDNLFPVTVDYSRSLKEMIVAGKYDWKNEDITEKHFPMTGKGRVELNLELVHFNKYISSDDAIAELKKRGLRPATLWELLAFGEKFQEKQREFPIVALGSVWRYFDGYRFVSHLWDGDGERSLYLGWYGNDWGGHCRFLSVRES